MHLLVSFRPLIRGLSISSWRMESMNNHNRFPSPHPGIINFFLHASTCCTLLKSFRPLIRGLSISSKNKKTNKGLTYLVSVPSSGDYQFLRYESRRIFQVYLVSVPSSGDYQFLHGWSIPVDHYKWVSVPSSGDYQFLLKNRCQKSWIIWVSVPSSGDYQFLRLLLLSDCLALGSFRPLIRGLSISSWQLLL